MRNPLMILGRPKNIWKNLQNPFFLERSYSILAIQTIKAMTDFLKSLTREEIELVNWLGQCTKGTWTIGKDGLVNVFGGFDCSRQDLKDFKGVKFGRVSKWFRCDHNNLTSLEGAPKEVGDNFDCSYNNLTSLEGAPKVVVNDFRCDHNNLTSLKGAPKAVGENFECDYNSLTNLEGAPKAVGENFDCGNNKLISLKGAPKEVGKNFSCDHNNLTSLKGAPKVVGENFFCDYNSLTNLKGAPQKVGGFFCNGNKLTSLEGAPQHTEGIYQSIAYFAHNPISERTLELIHVTMIEHNVPYVIALGMVKNNIKEDEYIKLSKGLTNKTLKGSSLLGRSMDI